LRAEGVGTGLDTSCAILDDQVKGLYEKCEFVIADLKFLTEADYKRYCKADVFSTVTDSLAYLDSIKKPVLLRTVLVPTVNEGDREKYEAFASRFSNIERYDFLPFHTMGFFKYEELGIINPLTYLKK
jgi:pyruvate formate lyase activating enzyme